MNTSSDMGRGDSRLRGNDVGVCGNDVGVCDTAWVCAGMSGGDTAGWCVIRRGGGGHVNWNRLSYNWGNSFELASLDVWTWRKT